ncbi:MAG: hypothetical protein WCQ16_08035 [Verrucomicrobiae bacterium]
MSRKSEILADLARSRVAIARDTSAVRSQLDLVARVRSSFQTRPFAWLGGATALGFLFARPKTRAKTACVLKKTQAPVKAEVRKPRGFWDILFALIKLSVPLLRPALSAYAARRIGDFAAKPGK